MIKTQPAIADVQLAQQTYGNEYTLNKKNV